MFTFGLPGKTICGVCGCYKRWKKEQIEKQTTKANFFGPEQLELLQQREFVRKCNGLSFSSGWTFMDGTK
jgi:hypothetical protein